MKKLSFTYKTTVEFAEPVEQHDFVLRCLPRTCDFQVVRARLNLEPSVNFDVQRDSFGNDIAVGSIIPEHSMFSYQISGTATVDRSLRRPVEAHPLFRYPTPRTAMTPAMKEFLADAAAAGMRSMVMDGLGAAGSTLFTCKNLMHQVYDLMEYKPGSTTVETTAQQAFEQRCGVCQDYAQLLIALLRACNIPARYASGITLGEGVSHAWVEAHVDGTWLGFDPTHNIMVDDRYLTIAIGRDWADCPVERGTMQGFTEQTQTVFMQVEEAE
ncbi:MAG: transglutaminase family protein [Coriobacteriia bacterium]|nr:transglutaminase family protein [Coriobacteriia bacterium]